jgi:alkylation response protein AidB-like acyl-CoA dehydrogenase
MAHRIRLNPSDPRPDEATHSTDFMITLPEIKHGSTSPKSQRMIRDMVKRLRANRGPAQGPRRRRAPPLRPGDLEAHRRTGTARHSLRRGSRRLRRRPLAYILAVEELAKVCGSTALTLAAHVSLGTYPIYAWGGDQLKQLYVPASDRRRVHGRLRAHRAQRGLRLGRHAKPAPATRVPPGCSTAASASARTPTMPARSSSRP